MASADRNAAQNPLDAAEVPHPMSKRWIPYKHSNGIAIYYHENVTEGHDYIGGEYMVSSIVRGTPEQCLAALTHRSSTTTILGPAAAVDVLSRDGDSQVLHLKLLPPLGGSLCGSFCAARHAVVQQVLKQEPHGIQCLMFSSIPERQAQQLLQQHQRKLRQQQRQRHHLTHFGQDNCSEQQQQQQGLDWQQQQQHQHHHYQPPQQHWIASVVQACQQIDYLLCRSWDLLGLAGSSGSRHGSGHGSRRSSNSSGWGLGNRLWRPMLVNVAGGYTISGLEGFEDDVSSESLVTCILKVDLGGWLSESSPGGWLYRPALGLGLVDQLVERMLSSVTLIKDEVEQQRFRSYPFALLEESVSDALDTSSLAHTRSTSCRGSSTGGTTAIAAAAAAGEFAEQRHCRQYSSTYGMAAQPAAVQQYSNSCQHGTLLSAVQGLVLSLSRLASWGLGFSSSSSSAATAHASRHSSTAGLGMVEPRFSSTSRLSRQSESGLAAAAAAVSASGAAPGSLAEQMVGIDEHGQPLTGLCNPALWSELHAPGAPSIYKVRGPTYLTDRAKVLAGCPAYTLLAVDYVSTPMAVQHVARYLPSVRRSRAASCFVVNMMVPSAETVLNLVMTFGSKTHWRDLQKHSSVQGTAATQPHAGSSSRSSSAGSAAGKLANGYCSHGGSSTALVADSSTHSGSSASSNVSSCTCSSGSSAGCKWSGFDHVLYRFIHAGDDERSSIFKMIPHIEVGSWFIKQTVGTTPVIVGRKLATTYHLTDRYMEVDIDVTTCKTAGYIVQAIRGVTTSMVVDLSFLLEGQRPCELPELLIGAVRLSHFDMGAATPLDLSREVPDWPQPWQ